MVSVVRCSLFALEVLRAHATFPPGFDTEFYCPSDQCLRMKSSSLQKHGEFGASAIDWECITRCSETSAERRSQPIKWSNNSGEEARHRLKFAGFNTTRCVDLRTEDCVPFLPDGPNANVRILMNLVIYVTAIAAIAAGSFWLFLRMRGRNARDIFKMPRTSSLLTEVSMRTHRIDGRPAETPDNSFTRWPSPSSGMSRQVNQCDAAPLAAVAGAEASFQPDLESSLPLPTVARPAWPSRSAQTGASASSLNAGMFSQIQRATYERTERLEGLATKSAECADHAEEFRKLAQALSKR